MASNQSFSKVIVILSLLFISLEANQNNYNQYQPVIGILTQPSNDLNQTQYPADKYQYISSSYVKWLEASGARVIGIPYDISEEQQDFLLKKLNGLVFPGGDASLWVDEDTRTGLSNMTLTGQRLIKRVIEINRNGTYFPLLGTCLGYELIVLALTNNDKQLNLLNSTNHVLNTHLFHETQSHQFSSLSKKQLFAVKNEEALYYNHRYGVTLESFKENKILHQFFRLTAYAYDDNGTSFVSSLEAKDFPIYGNQFHPEKNSYEWLATVRANHSPQAIEVAQSLGNFFVNEARKNNNTFSDVELYKFNIEKKPLKTVYEGFVSVYIFKNQNFTESGVNQFNSKIN